MPSYTYTHVETGETVSVTSHRASAARMEFANQRAAAIRADYESKNPSRMVTLVEPAVKDAGKWIEAAREGCSPDYVPTGNRVSVVSTSAPRAKLRTREEGVSRAEANRFPGLRGWV